jgi:nucleoside-diphosphate-sugar epimerase
VLVTGAGGFIGSHLAGRLARQGARVRAFLRYTSRGETGALGFEEGVEVETIAGDLRDPEAVARATAGVERIFHLGALIAVPYSYLAPREVVETNVLGTLNILSAARGEGTERIVCLSTSEVYGSSDHAPIAESQPPRAQSPYAASKVGADMLALSFQHSYGVPVALARPFNVYGPRQSARAIVPAIIGQALAGGPIRLGSLHPVRDMTYVGDTVEGLLAIGAWDGAAGRVVQLGTGEGVKVSRLVELVGEILGCELEVEHDPRRVRPESSEVDWLVCDPTVAMRELGWRAEVPLREGLEKTADWIKANPGWLAAGGYAV